jgi:hypothetical protein
MKSSANFEEFDLEAPDFFFFFFFVVVGFVGFLVWVFQSGETALDKFHKISSPLRLH